MNKAAQSNVGRKAARRAQKAAKKVEDEGRSKEEEDGKSKEAAKDAPRLESICTKSGQGQGSFCSYNLCSVVA